MGLPVRNLLTIVTESAIESLLMRDLERLGAQGYTVSDARGKGSRGVRNADWDSSRSVRIEVVCDAPTADRIAAHLQRHHRPACGEVLMTRSTSADAAQPSSVVNA